MTNTPIVDAQGQPVKEKEEQQQPEQKQMKLDDIQTGYIVGIDKNNESVFDVIGQQPGMIQLLGLHELAGHHIDLTRESTQGIGTPVMMKQLAQISQMLQILLNMATQEAKSGPVK